MLATHLHAVVHRGRGTYVPRYAITRLERNRPKFNEFMYKIPPISRGLGDGVCGWWISPSLEFIYSGRDALSYDKYMQPRVL